MSKMKRITDISDKVRQIVYERDGHRCIVSGCYNVQVAHYIPRSRGGMGIPENLVCLSPEIHMEYDNGKHHCELKKLIEGYLSSCYPNWDQKKLFFCKWGKT